MKPYIFEKSTILEASVEDVFAFHENPRNLMQIAPATLRVISIECEVRAVEGEKFAIHARQFGIPIRWVGVWEKVEQPNLLVDGAEKSPFAFWRHSHIFEAEGSGCRMTDRVECRLPGGRLGAVAGALGLPLVFGPMFRARHEATRRWFREKKVTEA